MNVTANRKANMGQVLDFHFQETGRPIALQPATRIRVVGTISPRGSRRRLAVESWLEVGDVDAEDCPADRGAEVGACEDPDLIEMPRCGQSRESDEGSE
jgi:hypothetical protein